VDSSETTAVEHIGTRGEPSTAKADCALPEASLPCTGHDLFAEWPPFLRGILDEACGSLLDTRHAKQRQQSSDVPIICVANIVNCDPL
jgi:hypothetical protein